MVFEVKFDSPRSPPSDVLESLPRFPITGVFGPFQCSWWRPGRVELGGEHRRAIASYQPAGKRSASKRKHRIPLGNKNFYCRGCKKHFSERTGSPFNDPQLTTDIALLALPWWLGAQARVRSQPRNRPGIGVQLVLLGSFPERLLLTHTEGSVRTGLTLSGGSTPGGAVVRSARLSR